MSIVKKINSIGIVILFSIFINTSWAQESGKNEPSNKGNIEEQFRFIIEKSSRYQDFKVVKEASLGVLRSNVLDTLKKLKNSLKASNNMVKTRELHMDSIKAVLQTTNNRLDETFREKNSVRFLGMLMSKEAYTKLMWFIISALALILIVFVILFKRSNKITVQNMIALEETRAEFDKFRKRALAREQELSRNHLAELNKYRKQSSGS